MALLRPLGMALLAGTVLALGSTFAAFLDAVPLLLIAVLGLSLLVAAIYQAIAWYAFSITFGPNEIFISELSGLEMSTHRHNVEGNILTCRQHLFERLLDIGTLSIETGTSPRVYTRLTSYALLYRMVGPNRVF
jgi:hypothetical protein